LLQEKNIFLAPGTIFGTAGAGYIRFSLCVPVEQINEAIIRWKG
jgi:LL-diaminopimelate aminotransferase